MKWIVLAILVFIAGYTFITLRYRKPGKSYEPYRQTRDRATQQRLEQAGYVRIAANISVPADPQRSAASLGKAVSVNRNVDGGMPAELASTLLDKPNLPDSFTNITAPSSVTALMPYTFQFTCSVPDKKFALAETYVYVKGDDIAVVPSFEKLGGELLARSRDNPILVSIPGGTLKPGEYTLRLIGKGSSRQWTVQVH
jgi:hypothetical protein